MFNNGFHNFAHYFFIIIISDEKCVSRSLSSALLWKKEKIDGHEIERLRISYSLDELSIRVQLYLFLGISSGFCWRVITNG